jgi:hypothetical protein
MMTSPRGTSTPFHVGESLAWIPVAAHRWSQQERAARGSNVMGGDRK